MRKYFYNNANFEVYTENEKLNSDFCASRFEYIGEYKNRSEAELARENQYPMPDPRGDIHYNDGKRR
jgi:hypothetical protein